MNYDEFDDGEKGLETPEQQRWFFANNPAYSSSTPKETMPKLQDGYTYGKPLAPHELQKGDNFYHPGNARRGSLSGTVSKVNPKTIKYTRENSYNVYDEATKRSVYGPRTDEYSIPQHETHGGYVGRGTVIHPVRIPGQLVKELTDEFDDDYKDFASDAQRKWFFANNPQYAAEGKAPRLKEGDSPEQHRKQYEDFLQTSHNRIANHAWDMSRYDERGNVAVDPGLVKQQAADFVKDKRDASLPRDYMRNLHREMNGPGTDAQVEGRINAEKADHAHAIMLAAHVGNVRLTDAQNEHLQSAVKGNYLNDKYSQYASGDYGTLAGPKTSNGPGKPSEYATYMHQVRRQEFQQVLDAHKEEVAVKKYTVVAHSGDKYAVHEQDDDGQPTGDPISAHKTRTEADAHCADLGKKGWGDDYDVSPVAVSAGPMTLSQDDPRVAYNPVGGMKGGKACANCSWFVANGNACRLVSGPIVPTGLSKLWLEERDYTAPPIQVQIVSQGSAEQPKRNLLGQVKELLSGRKQDEAIGFKVLPDHRWIAYWSNNFEDKEGETFTQKAHDDYIARVDGGKTPLPELWYWHIPGTRHGQAEWLGRVDHINVAVGRFDDTPTGRAFETFYGGKAKAHKVSHGYFYPRAMKQSGAYHAYTTFEISPLPAGREANAITGFSSVQEMKEMAVPEEKRRALEAILGKELAAKTLNDAERQSKEAEALGVKFKEATDPVAAVDAEVREAVKEVAAARAEDAQGIKALGDKLDGILTAIKGIQDGETARDTKMKQLEEATKAMFELQPSPRQSNNTALPPDNPLVKVLKEAQEAQKAAGEPRLGIFDLFVKEAQTPGGQ